MSEWKNDAELFALARRGLVALLLWTAGGFTAAGESLDEPRIKRHYRVRVTPR